MLILLYRAFALITTCSTDSPNKLHRICMKRRFRVKLTVASLYPGPTEANGDHMMERSTATSNLFSFRSSYYYPFPDDRYLRSKTFTSVQLLAQNYCVAMSAQHESTDEPPTKRQKSRSSYTAPRSSSHAHSDTLGSWN